MQHAAARSGLLLSCSSNIVRLCAAKDPAAPSASLLRPRGPAGGADLLVVQRRGRRHAARGYHTVSAAAGAFLSPLSRLEVFMTAAGSPDILFSATTACVVPLYILMLAAPRWRMTRLMLESPAIFLVLALVYAHLLVQSWQADTVALMFSARGWPELSSIAAMFLRPASAAAFWVHLLCLDLFVGRRAEPSRFVFLDAARTRTPATHSLLLCMTFGPLGFISHLATKVAFSMLLSRKRKAAAAAATTSGAAGSTDQGSKV